jgi:hypothetical protein
VTQPSFQFVQSFGEFKHQLRQMTDGLFGGETVLASKRLKFMGSISRYTGISFRDRMMGRKQATKNGRLQVTLRRGDRLLDSIAKDRYNNLADQTGTVQFGRQAALSVNSTRGGVLCW